MTTSAKTKRTSSFLMANLGAEVSRIFSAKKAQDEIRAKECLIRAENILKEIMTFPDMKKRATEIEILSEVIRGIAIPKPTITVSEQNITSYFMPFALQSLA